MKHAYLILAHTSVKLLTELIASLDDERNDIYIHLDKKFNIDLSVLQTQKSRLRPISQRLDARWGDYSLVKAEYLLYETAFSNGPYEYYHLLSGVDHPVKTQDYIHDFCKKNKGKEFIGFALHTPKREIQWRSQHYFLFSKSFKSSNLLLKVIRSAFARFQTLIGYKRTDLTVLKGCQWTSVTNEFVAYLIDNKKNIEQIFNHTYCPDEFVAQTLCWNSHFKNNIYDLSDEFNGCLRFITWKEGVIQNMDDVSAEEMVYSNKLFARKFTESGLDTINSIQRLLEV